MTRWCVTLDKGRYLVTCGRKEQKVAWRYEVVGSGTPAAKGMKSWEKRVYGSFMKALSGYSVPADKNLLQK